MATETGFVSLLFFPSPSMVAAGAQSIAGTADLWMSITAASRRVGFGLALVAILMGAWWTPAHRLLQPPVNKPPKILLSRLYSYTIACSMKAKIV
jgi:taurine transport system permease protein